MNIFIISDTHFLHEKIKKFEHRPDDFNELIIKNWNKVVTDSDLVIHLGDVIFGMEKDKNLSNIMAQLKGYKVLTRGNHDSYPTSKWGDWKWFMERGFDMVTDYFVYENLSFSHAPLTPLPRQGLKNPTKLVDYNIHGHFHRGVHRGVAVPDQYYDIEYYNNNKKKYKLIQIEDELRPFTLEEILND